MAALNRLGNAWVLRIKIILAATGNILILLWPRYLQHLPLILIKIKRFVTNGYPLISRLFLVRFLSFSPKKIFAASRFRRSQNRIIRLIHLQRNQFPIAWLTKHGCVDPINFDSFWAKERTSEGHKFCVKLKWDLCAIRREFRRYKSLLVNFLAPSAATWIESK